MSRAHTMRQLTKLKQLLSWGNLEVKSDDAENVQITIIDKADLSIGIFEGKTFSEALNKAHPQMKKIKHLELLKRLTPST